MADLQRNNLAERDTEQMEIEMHFHCNENHDSKCIGAYKELKEVLPFDHFCLTDDFGTEAIATLKKGAYLLKYGQRGKPKFCPFRISNDETLLIWYTDETKKWLNLSHVSRIIPGQRTAIFQRYPRPDKEYQSFSIIYNDRSLDLICKDKDEAEIWFVALRALISRSDCCKWNVRSNDGLPDSQRTHTQRNTLSTLSFVSSSNRDLIYEDQGDTQTSLVPSKNHPQKSLGKTSSDVILYNAAAKGNTQAETVTNCLSSRSSVGSYNPSGRSSAVDSFRISSSSAISSSSQGSAYEYVDTLGDVYIWGERIGYGMLGGGLHRVGSSSAARIDALLPKPLESTVVLDAHNIACGSKHAVLVTKQGEIFSWGEGSGGRLGHEVEAGVSHPKLINALSGLNIELVACGECHTCAVTRSGNLYTWGDGTHNFGLLGHASDASHWTPKKISGLMEGMHVTCISCGPWHTAAVTSSGQLFTFGDGTFGALGHADRSSTSMPREVETLKGLRTVTASCGVWHTAAVVEVTTGSFSSESSSAGKLFTWGDGDKGQLGHGDKEPRLVPSCVAVSDGTSFCQVACGHSITVALTATGRVYTMGSADYGQLGSPKSAGKLPTCIGGKIRNSFIEEIACGSHHVAVLSSKEEVFTWGKGANGQLGHGDNNDRNSPTLVEALINKQVKSVVCGSNFTVAICLHKWVCSADHSICSGCHKPFSFRRKRHNCYNCGLIICKACSSRKSIRAALAPNMNKPYRVCDDCFTKLKEAMYSGSTSQFPKVTDGSICHNVNQVAKKETMVPTSHGRLSKLLSFASFKKADSQPPKHSPKLELNSGRVHPIPNGSSERGNFDTSKRTTSGYSNASVPTSRNVSRAPSPVSRKSSSLELNSGCVNPIPNGSFEWGNFDRSKTSTLVFGYSNTSVPTSRNVSRATSPISRKSSPSPFVTSKTSTLIFGYSNASVPTSRNVSRATSPVSRKSSPSSFVTLTSNISALTCPEVVLDDSKQTNDSPIQEITILRAQVEDLTRKSQFLGAELEKTSRQLKEATVIAKDEAEKKKAAKEVIRSLTTQLKGMAKGVLE